jgi:hypothetical protein
MGDDVAKQGTRILPNNIDYLALWQYFERRGSELKGVMLQLLTLVIGLAAAILGYAVDKTVDFNSAPFIRQPLLLLIITAVGVLIVTFAEIVTQEFGEHINRNFDRADYARRADKPLDDILAFSERGTLSKQKLPGICITVRRLTRAFGVLFAVGFVLGLVQLLR